MSLSSNSVIHFTSTIENLEGILKEGFEVSYCLEEIRTNGDMFISAAIPMVSFCDIPFSEVKNHIENYGSYGIGLTKEWAVEKRLNPVLYIERNSMIAQNLTNTINHYFDPKADIHRIQLLDVIRYLKNYERDLARKGSFQPNYRFYDEREWRFVPDLDHDPIFIGGSIYKSLRDEEQQERKKTNLKLKFGINDISYIIINDESEIEKLITLIKNHFNKSSILDVDKLITRIITVRQIHHDF